MPSGATMSASYEAVLYQKGLHRGLATTAALARLEKSYTTGHFEMPQAIAVERSFRSGMLIKQFHNAARFIRASTVTWRETWLQQIRIDRVRVSFGPHAIDQPRPKCGPNSSELEEAQG